MKNKVTVYSLVFVFVFVFELTIRYWESKGQKHIELFLAFVYLKGIAISQIFSFESESKLVLCSSKLK